MAHHERPRSAWHWAQMPPQTVWALLLLTAIPAHRTLRPAAGSLRRPLTPSSATPILLPPSREPVDDFPGGAMHVKQRALGIDDVLVNGEVLREGGEHSGALPGQVLRGLLDAGNR